LTTDKLYGILTPITAGVGSVYLNGRQKWRVKMKKFATALLMVLFMLSFTAMTFAGVDKAASSKMERGSKNFFLGWTEIPKNIVSTSKGSNAFVGITVGTLKGIGQAFARTVSGAVDIITSPFGSADKPAIQPTMIPEGTPKPAPAKKPVSAKPVSMK